MREPSEVRAHVARSLHGGAEAIVTDAVALYPFAGLETVGVDDRAPLAGRALQLIIAAVRDGALEASEVRVSELAARAEQKKIGVRPLFTVVHLVERAALDALALDDSFGVSSAPWPALAQTIRGASFDLCAALAEHLSGTVDAGIIDTLTTLYTKAVFLAALDKEIQRAERLGEPFALMVIDVDRLTDINTRYGYGAGDRVLERVGIVVRNYFRDTDWVARLGADVFAVLLPAIHGRDAQRLAERMRVTVQERLQVHDHRSDQQFPVTISVGVFAGESIERTVKAEQLVEAAQRVIVRAKQAGGNRVERATLTP
ncbi:MAG: GGDEF domain-containing protein [Acidobacteria bacterium]|nr:GGDEF domain-containing protein [Acidobacteriota bacterium]